VGKRVQVSMLCIGSGAVSQKQEFVFLPIEDGVYLIGRSSVCHLQLSEFGRVSGRHVRIQEQDGDIYAVNLGRHGTTVHDLKNDRDGTMRPAHPGNQLGATPLLLQQAGQAVLCLAKGPLVYMRWEIVDD